MKRIIGLATLVVAFGAVLVAPAGAGQSDVVPGAKYKAEYNPGAGMAYNLKIKTSESGKRGTFTLKCAGIEREKIQIERGHFKLAFGADEVTVKGRGHFLRNDQVKGAITKVTTPGATCAGGGEFFGAAIDTD